MKPKGYKRTRCEKRTMSKCPDGVVRTFNVIESRYADLLEANPDIKEFRSQVLLDGLELGEYCSDFVAKKADGELLVRECLFRKSLLKPVTGKRLDASREYWYRRGVIDWGIVLEKEDEEIEEESVD